MKKFIPYNSDEIESALEQRVLDSGLILPDDIYEGSNIKQIIGIMSYLGSLVNTNTTFGVNEMILTQATRRKNVLKLARQLGYEPTRKLSYIYKVRLKVKESGHIQLNTYTRFKSGEKYYYYMGTPIDRVGFAGEVIEIEVKEGKLLHYKEDVGLSFIIDKGNLSGDLTYVTSVTGTYFDIDYSDIEEDGVEVWVSEPPYVENMKWTKREFNLDVVEHQVNNFANSYVAIRNIDKDNLRVYFNFAGTGEVPQEASYVNCVVLISSGADGAADGLIDLDDKYTENLSMMEYIKVYRYGIDEESTDKIKEQAPLFHSSAYRAITANDYKVILETNSFVSSTSVWGGEEVFPPILGHIWFSTLTDRLSNSKFITDNTTWTRKFTDFDNNLDEIDIMYVSDGNIDIMNQRLDKYKIITIQTHHEQPKFLRMNYDVSIVNKNVMNNDSKTAVVNELLRVYRDMYEQFNASYYNSTVTRYLDDVVGEYNGIVNTLTCEMALTEKDLKGVVSLDEYWQVGEEERYLNTCGICINDELASQYAFDINIYLAYPAEPIFNYETNEVLYNNLPVIDTDNFIYNTGTALPDVNKLYVDWEAGKLKYHASDNWLSYQIMFDGKKSGKYNIINTSKQKYIHIQLHVGSTEGTIGLDMYDLSGLKKIHFVESPQVLKVQYPSPNINFVKNTIPILNKITFI